MNILSKEYLYELNWLHYAEKYEIVNIEQSHEVYFHESRPYCDCYDKETHI